MESLKITSNCNMSIRKMQEVLQKNAVLNGKISAFSGNSGVGKSSLTSKIMGDTNIEIGEISKKNKRSAKPSGLALFIYCR